MERQGLRRKQRKRICENLEILMYWPARVDFSCVIRGETMESSKHSPTRFNDLSIRGFRRLGDVRFPLRPLCVMIGANGTGKTSVLDVMSLLANSARGKLSASITDLSGLTSVITYDRDEELRLGKSIGGPKHLLLH